VGSARASASMSVGSGSFNDGDIMGLAHFCEHMLFLGSKTFSKPSEFETHLDNYFGITNAFTEPEKTTFYFELGANGFEKALVMFSRMFAEPLFDMEFMNKEIDAVNSEHNKNLNQDIWKENELIKSLSNPKHPYNKFHTGNNQTFRQVSLEALNAKLKEYYQKYYIPTNMKLVVMSKSNI